MQSFFKGLVLVMLIFATSVTGIINVPADQPSIQAGINAAMDGDIVLVADSTYYENINFKGKAITVASHFLVDGDTSHISNTIIDGSQPNHPDSGSVVYFISGEDTTSILCGFTITGGTGTYFPFVPIRASGGICCFNSGAKIISNYIENNSILSSTYAGSAGISVAPFGNNHWAVISNNRIRHNTTQGVHWVYGGAMEVMSNAYIKDNLITHNLGNNHNGISPALVTGVLYFGDDKTGTERNIVYITGNTISHNEVISNNYGCNGGGIHGVGSQVFIKNNTVTNNVTIGNTYSVGGGIDLVRFGAGSIVANNYIAYNEISSGSAKGGGIRVLDCETEIINNIIVGNRAGKGAGIYIYTYSKDKIINNTLINNYASVFGGGLYIDNAHPKIFNTILWDSCAQSNDPEIKIENGGSIEIYYSNIKGNWPGTGNMDSDPLFVPGDTLYNLSDSSLCIGAGIDSLEFGGIWYYAPPLDYNGDPRPIPAGSMPDIGAQESPLNTPNVNIIKEESLDIPIVFSLSQNYPNPFNPTTTIEFSIPKSEYVTLKIYNLIGQEVATLVSEKLTLGNYKNIWNAGHLASGVYYYKLKGRDFVKSRKLILIK